MPFNPDPIQVQALQIARRFQLGFRPTKLAGQPVTPKPGCRNVKFETVPANVLSAELHNPPRFAELIDELCQRGYLKAHQGYPKCVFAPMEYVTENGDRVCVNDEDWCDIDVRSPHSRQVWKHWAGHDGQILFDKSSRLQVRVVLKKHNNKTAKARGKEADTVRGTSYELLPLGFKLLDELEQGEEPGRGRTKRKQPAWAELVLYESSDGSDHIAELDGKRIRIRGDAAFQMLKVLQEKQGDRIKAAALQQQIGQRPDRVLKRLDKRLQRIIDRPGRGHVGYAMR